MFIFLFIAASLLLSSCVDAQVCQIGTISWYLSYKNQAGYYGSLSQANYFVGPGAVPVCAASYGFDLDGGGDSYFPIRNLVNLTDVNLHPTSLLCYSDLLGMLPVGAQPMIILGSPTGGNDYLCDTAVTGEANACFIAINYGIEAIPWPKVNFVPNAIVAYNESVYYTIDLNTFFSIPMHYPSTSYQGSFSITATNLCSGSVQITFKECLLDPVCYLKYSTTATTTPAVPSPADTTRPPSTTASPTTFHPTTAAPDTGTASLNQNNTSSDSSDSSSSSLSTTNLALVIVGSVIGFFLLLFLLYKLCYPDGILNQSRFTSWWNGDGFFKVDSASTDSSSGSI